MDSKEFAVWATRLKVLFPKFGEYMDNLDDNYRNEISAEWERALSRVEFGDAMESLTDIHTGDAKPFNQWEYGTWVAHVRKLANSRRAQRYEAENRNQPSYDEPSGGFNLSGALREVLAIKDAGGDTTEVLNRLLPIDDNGPRFKCRHCQDSGFVRVWHVVTMRAAAKGDEIIPRLKKSMQTICNCDLGRAKISPEKGKGRQFWTEDHVYDESRHCLYGSGSLDDLREFVQSIPQRQLESHPNFNATLAQYKGTD